MLKVGDVKEVYEMKGAGRSVRGIARELDIARNTVRRYLHAPEAMAPQATASAFLEAGRVRGVRRTSPGEGLENCVVLHRELRERGYDGGFDPEGVRIATSSPRAPSDDAVRDGARRTGTGGLGELTTLGLTAAGTGSGPS